MANFLTNLFKPKSPVRQSAGQFVENVGNFFGLPEGNKSEWIAGGPTKQTMGVLGAQKVQAQAPRTQVGPAGTVQYKSPVGPAGVVPYQQSAYQAPQNQGAGIAPQGNSGVNSGGGGGDQGNYLQQVPDAPQIDWDALIAPALQGLDEAIGPLQQQFAGTQTGIEANKATNLASNQANISGQAATLNQARSSQVAEGENAVNEARRQQAEIQQGLQSRYGGTSGTGAFAGELAGRQTLQNIGKIREGVSQAMLQIDDKLQQVQEIGRISTQDIEDKASAQIRDAKSNLDNQLADIRRQKGELQANKAQLASQAIQLYQNTVNQVNANNAQFKQQIYMKQMETEQTLKLAQQRAQKVAESFSLYNFTNESGVTNPVRVGNQGSVQNIPDLGAGQLTTLGTKLKKDEEEETLF
jgi:hypothetical protein